MLPRLPVAVYLGAPFDVKGKRVGPDGYTDALDKYLYNTWDEGSRQHSYNLEHEPLAVTLARLEHEVVQLNRGVVWPDQPQDVIEGHFCDPLESISVHVFVNKKLPGFELHG